MVINKENRKDRVSYATAREIDLTFLGLPVRSLFMLYSHVLHSIDVSRKLSKYAALIQAVVLWSSLILLFKKSDLKCSLKVKPSSSM